MDQDHPWTEEMVYEEAKDEVPKDEENNEGHDCTTGNDESSVEVENDPSYLSEFTDERLDYLMELERARIDTLSPLERLDEQIDPFWTEY